jgi:phosphate transport system substrate-binding protein
MAEEERMRAWLVWAVAVILGLGGWAPAEAASDLSGKITLFVTGREQGAFEKAGVKFEKQFPRVRVKFADPEGAQPLTALTEGAADVAVLGRALTPEEKDFTGTVVGWEGIAIMVNASNRVADVNIRQIGDIFSGKAKTWDELGGHEAKITVIHREEGKGVRPYFEQQLNLAGKMVNGKGIVEPDKEAVRVVSGSINAVTYINLNTAVNNVSVGVPVRLLSLSKVEPELANVSSGAYPLRRPITLVTKGALAPHVKAFIEFMTGKEGQKTIQEEDFVPLLVTK